MLCSLQWCVKIILQNRTLFVTAGPDTVYVFDNNLGVFGEGTRLAMPKTRLRAGLIVIEAWFRGY